MEGTLFQRGVHLAINEDAGAEVFLGLVAEKLVLGHDALVHLVDELEVLFCGVLVAVDFVAHGCVCGAVGEEALDHEEVGSVSTDQREVWLAINGYHYEIFIEALGKE